MDASLIAELLDPFLRVPRPSSAWAGLSPAQLNQISTYIDLLLRWNARINLTAIRAPGEIVTRHFGESLFAASHLLPCGAHTPVRETAPTSSSLHDSPPHPTKSASPPSPKPPAAPTPIPAPATAERVVDVGSGPGFPGLPIKIWSPQTRVTLIESNHKKVAFLREVIRALTLTDIDVFPARAETFPPASATLVTLRAVERFDQALPTAVRLLAPHARLALLIGQAQLPRARQLTDLDWSTPLPIPQSEARVLAIATRNSPIQAEPNK